MSHRTDAYSIFINDTDKAKLSSQIVGIIENYEKRTISNMLKAKNGTPQGIAAMIYKRFVNSASQVYGTARTALAGNKIVAPETVVNLDIKREIIEEVNKFDLETFGIPTLAENRKENFRLSLNREMERKFFLTALTQGTQTFAIDTTDVEASLETKIQALETLQNDYVDGVERDQMALVLKPAIFGKLKNKLNDTNNTIVTVEGEEIPAFNGVATFSSTYLPANVDAVLMVYGSIAQPLRVDEYGLDKIQFSNDWALELFYDYGIKALAPDLVFVAITGAEADTAYSVVSALPVTGEADTIYIVSGTGAMSIWDATGEEFVAYTGTLA